jgi:hypothetical protein
VLLQVKVVTFFSFLKSVCFCVQKLTFVLLQVKVVTYCCVILCGSVKKNPCHCQNERLTKLRIPTFSLGRQIFFYTFLLH